MRVVVDTSVVLSAAFRDRTPEEVVLFIAHDPDIEWVASTAILTEYVEVLRRPKFGLPEALVRQWEEIFNLFIIIIDVLFEVPFPRDPKDAKFLACAIVAEADYFITSDKDFIEAYRVMRTTVCSVSQFRRLVIDR